MQMDFTKSKFKWRQNTPLLSAAQVKEEDKEEDQVEGGSGVAVVADSQFGLVVVQQGSEVLLDYFFP
jgi:hypothetical protein